MSQSQKDDLDYWGAPPDYIEHAENIDLLICRENWDVLTLFVRLQTQWRYSPSGTRTGLEYSSIRMVCNTLKIAFTADLFSDLQYMELTMINIGHSK